MKNKPRTKLCWICGNKFWGNKFTIVTTEEGHEHEVHKFCAKQFEKERREEQSNVRPSSLNF